MELPVDRLFTYSVPASLKESARLGFRALVPFGRRTITGYIISFVSEPEVKDVKEIIDVLDDEPLFDEKRLKFFKWLSSYYFSSLGDALSLTHPPSANIKSSRHFSISGKGAAAFDKSREQGEGGENGLTSFEKDMLGAVKNGASAVSLERRFKGKPVCAALRSLVKKGLLNEETRLKGGASEKTERFAMLLNHVAEPDAGFFRRAPLKEKLWRHLKENGETPVAELGRAFGSVAGALKSLKDAGFAEIIEKRALRDPLSDLKARLSNHEPAPEQAEAIKAVSNAVDRGGYAPFLLFGVTGSGKTLVYLNAIEHAVKCGKKAIFTVPEIALTPWPAAYLKQRFPGRVALWHSGLSEGERLDEWQRIKRGEADIVVGARSALFAPIKDLGLIIVDEEHETSYKQEEGVRYNGRDAALKLAHTLGVAVVLGSATPSVETFYNATSAGKLTPLYLKSRVEGTLLPEVELIDMRGKKAGVFSERLKALLSETLEKKEQALLFLNRRGFSSTLICKDCGRTFPCLNCSVTLTLHKRPLPGSLTCHYCDLSVPAPDECPDCKGTNLAEPGYGTEKVEDEAKALFSHARVIRMDKDTTGPRSAAMEIITAVEAREADILVGTQMASKGHHFPGITLVGVISADTSLNIPDFRGAERTFHLITQALGRAGRGEKPGVAVIQTLNPGHYAFTSAMAHDYEVFFNEEIKLRREVFYPPFSRLCSIRLDGLKETAVTKAAVALKASADAMQRRRAQGIAVLGPAPALIPKLRGRYRWNLLVKGDAKDINGLHSFITGVKAAFDAKKHTGVSLTIDMDPVSIV